MAAETERCDHAGCIEPARKFTFLQGVRTMVCRNHLEDIEECMTIFDISRAGFIESEDHVAAFFERQGRLEKGRKHLRVLEERCEQTLAEAQALEQASKKLRERTEDYCRQVKEQLERSGHNLAQLVVDRDFQLNAEDAALCIYLPENSALQTSLRDCRQQLELVLQENLQGRPEEEKMQVELEAEDRVEVNSDASETASPVHSEAGSEPSRLHRLSKSTIQAKKHLIKGIKYREAGKYTEALESLQRARSLMQYQECEDAELSLHLGLTNLHFGNWDEAERELRRGLYPQFNPADPLSVRVSVALAELYFQKGLWTDTINECETVLHALENYPVSAEMETALFFLVNSHYQLHQSVQGDEVVDKWTHKLGNGEPSSILFFINGEKLRVQGKAQEAATQYEKGLQQYQLPQSYITVFSGLSLGAIYKTMENHQKAAELYRAALYNAHQHFPASLARALCLTKLSVLDLALQELPRDVEAQLQEAHRIYDKLPKSAHFADCLYYEGLLCKKMPRNAGMKKAEKHLLHACELYKIYAPESLELARCLDNLADIYYELGEPKRALEPWSEALSLYKALQPESLVLADCMHNLAMVQEKHQKEAAEHLFLEACRIYELLAPRSLGLATYLEEAGDFFKRVGERNKALRFFERAAEIFEERGEARQVKKCNEEIGRLYRNSSL